MAHTHNHASFLCQLAELGVSLNSKQLLGLDGNMTKRLTVSGNMTRHWRK